MSNKRKIVGSMLNETVTLGKVHGQVVVNSGPPRPRRTLTAKQEAVRKRFLRAAQYASQQIEQEESNALYAKGITDKMISSYVIAMSDYLNPPEVNSIDAHQYRGVIGGPIVVDASDDFMVTQVWVKIQDATGTLLEEGAAGPDPGNIHLWIYKATVANAALAGTKIQATAYDKPGNSGTLEVAL